MKYNIEKYTGSYNLSRRYGAIKYLVIHYTAAQTPDYPHAKNNCQYFAGGNRNASADWFIDNESIYQYNPDPSTYYTWEVGDGGGRYGITNSNSIGIEVCQIGDQPFTEQEIDRLADLTQHLMATYGIPAERVVRHYDASRKSCPEYYARRQSEWNKLHARITQGVDDEVNEQDKRDITNAVLNELPAKVWEYVWGEDQNRDNMYNRVSAILTNTYGIHDSLESVMARLTMPTPVVPFGGEVHRLYKDGAHTYTNSSSRLADLTRNGWDDEGVKFALSTGGDAVYELVNPYDNDCVLTVDMREAENLAGAEWQSFGIVGTSGDGVEVHRLHDPNGLHLFTVDEAEAESLKSAGWTYEGVAFQAA